MTTDGATGQSGRRARLPRPLIRKAAGLVVRVWNRVLAERRGPPVRGALPASVAALVERMLVPTDISEHLTALLYEAVTARPRLIVELGTRRGESTRALLAAAEWSGATLVSVDAQDCSGILTSDHWLFVQSEDVAFGRWFGEWARQRGLATTIDLLLIDTNHLYEHTCKETEVWFGYLDPWGKAVFHDTNLRPWYRRRDGTIGYAWDNRRGVIRALEELLGLHLEESRAFETVVGDWAVRHVPTCLGLTVLHRLGRSVVADEGRLPG